MAASYCNLERKKIGADEYFQLSENPLYGLFASYNNDKFLVRVVYDGKIDTDAPKEYFNIVKLEYLNKVVDEKGERWVKDPVLSESFFDLNDAIDKFRSVLSEEVPDLDEETLVNAEFATVAGYKGKLPRDKRAEELAERKEAERIATLNTPVGYGDSW